MNDFTRLQLDEGKITEKFPVKREIRQRDFLNALLFNAEMNGIVHYCC